MDSQEKTTSVLLGVASIGLGVIAFLNPALRLAGFATLIAVLITLFLVLRIEQVATNYRTSRRSNKVLEEEVNGLKGRLDLYKKIYKLEFGLRNLEKMMNKKGEWNPIWGVVILVFLVLLYFILKATGVL